jgi:CheY-like chemotaxis protein
VKVTNGSTWNVSPLVSSAGQAIELLATMGLVVVLVVFMLLNREDVRSRLVRLLGEGRMTLTTKALDDAAQRIGRYLLAQLGLNTAFGLFIGGGLWLADVPYALVWGFCAALLRYFPFIGPWVATILPLTFSLLTADGWLQPLAVVLLFVVCEILCNLVFEPWLYGQSIGVSQAALLVAIAFWTWLWGPGGLLLAPPLTVCLVVLGKYVPALKFFDILLGDEPALTPEVTYYQRLLARDQDEASDLIREQFQEHSPEETFDRILIPALGNARRDLDANRVTEGDFDFIVGTTGEIVEELDLARPQDEHDLNGDECMVGRLEILLCAARDGIDQTALFMLQRLLDSKKYATEFVSNDRLVSEVVDLVASESPSVVCISALPPGGLAHTRLLCKRLRQRFPELKIIVGRWGLKSNIESNREQLLAAGADQLGTTIAETCAQIRNLRQRAAPRPAAVVTGPPIPR